jgi:hypothetical protein
VTDVDVDCTERELQIRVVDLARMYGWMAVHFGGDLHGKAHYDATGFPDLVLIHARRNLVWFRELKSAKGKLTDRQQRWYDRLVEAGANVDVWRPADWPDIVRALSNGAARVGPLPPKEIAHERPPRELA